VSGDAWTLTANGLTLHDEVIVIAADPHPGTASCEPHRPCTWHPDCC